MDRAGEKPLLLDPGLRGMWFAPVSHRRSSQFGAVLRRALASEKRAQAMRWQLRLFLALSFVFTACVALALARVTAFELSTNLSGSSLLQSSPLDCCWD
jgi:hypothetical protein